MFFDFIYYIFQVYFLYKYCFFCCLCLWVVYICLKDWLGYVVNFMCMYVVVWNNMNQIVLFF